MFTPTIPFTSGTAPPYNYYLMYKYSELMNMVNSAFNKLFTTGSIAAAITAFTSTSFAPFIEIDPHTLKCSIAADRQFFVNRYNGKDFVDNPNINIYFNTALRALFPSFPYKFNSATGDLNF